MKKETQTKRRVSLCNSLAEYAASISPNGTISDGIRVALKYHRVTEANIDKMVEALETTPTKEEG